MTLKFRWSLCVLLQLIGSLITSQIYRLFKQYSYDAYVCLYDSSYYGWYYYLATIYLLVSLILAKFQKLKLSGKPMFWVINKRVSNYIFFIETEAVIQFVYTARDVEYMLEDMNDQMMIIILVVAGVIRWGLSLANLNNTDRIMRKYLHRDIDRSVIQENRTAITACFAQNLADYTFFHYIFYKHLYNVRQTTIQLLFHYIYTMIFLLFYICFARKEFTFGHFII